MSHDHHDEYNEQFVAGLEWMWGKGFMSPGGAEEVAAILEGIDVRGMRVLDIGCGIGGIDALLVKQHGAAHVTGIDVEAPLIKRAREMAISAELTQNLTFQHIAPGSLPFDDNSFDLVFSKDALLHIPDKSAIYADIFRVLKPGGHVAFSDWFGSDLPDTLEYLEWLVVIGLTLEMGTIDAATRLMAAIGFDHIKQNDRNAWYAQNILEELATLQGEQFDRLIAQQGLEFAQQRLKSSSLKKVVVDQGMLRPGHIQAQKPTF